MLTSARWSTLRVNWGSPSRYRLHLFIPWTTARISSSIVAYLLSVSFRNLDPHVIKCHCSPCFWNNAYPMPFSLDASVCKQVSYDVSKFLRIGDLQSSFLTLLKAFVWASVHLKIFFLLKSDRKGSISLLRFEENSPSWFASPIKDLRPVIFLGSGNFLIACTFFGSACIPDELILYPTKTTFCGRI